MHGINASRPLPTPTKYRPPPPPPPHHHSPPPHQQQDSSILPCRRRRRRRKGGASLRVVEGGERVSHRGGGGRGSQSDRQSDSLSVAVWGGATTNKDAGKEEEAGDTKKRTKNCWRSKAMDPWWLFYYFLPHTMPHTAHKHIEEQRRLRSKAQNMAQKGRGTTTRTNGERSPLGGLSFDVFFRDCSLCGPWCSLC